jgi:CheY-like chemotaxis protein
MRKPRVLVVDDNDDNRELYAEFFAAEGFAVEQARDGKEALARVKEFVPDVVLMDLSLPVLDGWEATRILKSDPDTQRITVLAVSGRTEEKYRTRAMEAGCDGFLAKPIMPADVRDEVMKRYTKTRAG